MALVPFAKASNLQTLAPAVSDDQAGLLLDLVSGTIRDALGWDVDKAVDATYTQDVPPGNCLEAVVLPALNLTAVSSVVVDGASQVASAYRFTKGGILYLTGILAFTTVAVTYTAGYARTPEDTAPPVLRAVALDYAMRMVANPTMVRKYAIGGTSEEFSDDLYEIARADCRLDGLRVKQ